MRCFSLEIKSHYHQEDADRLKLTANSGELHSVTFIEYGQNVKKTQYLIDKAILGCAGIGYFMYVVCVDKGQ